MKKVLVVNSLMLIFVFSCTSDGLPEDNSPLPDMDIVQITDDENGSDYSNEITDNTIVEQPDENTSQTDQEETTDEGGTIQGCGNEKVEYEERDRKSVV